eukprot:scaffold1786_cov138-Cylindrotheca_fusiformis.AAC.14
MDPPTMTTRSKSKRSKTGENGPKFFVYTSETEASDIPRMTMTHLRVDSSVREIPERAFELCRELIQVQFPDTLTRIKGSAFRDCSKLKSFQFVSPDASLTMSSSNQDLEDGLSVFPETTTLQIDDSAFAYCHGLRKINFCSVSTKFSRSAFYHCNGLVSVQLPEGLQVIEPCLFHSCESLATIKIPLSVNKISSGAFVGCQSLSSIDFPRGLLEIGDGCFYKCTSMEALYIPPTVSIIGRNAFSACARLKLVKLPEALEILDKLVFAGCGMLECIEIPTLVKTIADMAFLRCTSLSHLRIPPSVENIGRQAFAGCCSMISIEVPEGLLLDSTTDAEFGISECYSLVNVAIPTLTGDPQQEGNFLRDLKLRSVADGYGDLLHKLKHRFDSSPVNKLCYYQSYHSPEEAMVKLSSLMNEDPLAATTQVDEFGMTPLHVLSLSQTTNLSMLLAVIHGGHPDAVVCSRDSFQSTPMDYLCLNKMPNSLDVVQNVVQATVGKRLDGLGLDQWKSNILQAIDEAMAAEWSSRRREIGIVYFKLAKYERKEIISLLELYLWKLKIDELCSKKESADRQNGRINCGSSIVIPNVLPFLDKLDMEDYFFVYVP